MKISLLIVLLSFSLLLSINIVQNETIHKQQNLIHQMTKNPACMIPASPKLSDN